MTLKVATRKSQLALWQAKHVCALLEKNGFTTELIPIETKGDKILHKSIAKIGSKGVFTEELEAMLIEGTADLAIHSAKDLQTSVPEGLDLIAFTEREKPCDVVVSFNKSAKLVNHQDFTVGTSSVRRIATLKRHYPKCRSKDIRGNLQTRIEKLEEGHCDALILAYAGVKRMAMEHLITEELSVEVFTPAVAQGSIAVQAGRHLSSDLRNKIAQAAGDPDTELCILAERAFLRQINGGCSIPAFALATRLPGSGLHIMGGIISPDGKQIARTEVTGSESEPELIGKELANRVLSMGGREILEKI